ncbi:LytR/AlgR family response regulator transcription factor [Gracilimonas sp.]|uniref:LytR/AlgR family response regulator transcription factor n=1 Tax=Gracilimonas sp. TaxID=1974203 RepID=UPI003D0C139D
MIKYLIIDDEPIAHGIIEKYCQSLPHLTKKGNCYNVKQAYETLFKTSIDLIFLDINMPEISGFEFLRSLSKPPQIIVTSAHREFAIEGFDLNVCDYLLKPFSFERFMKAINKASENLQDNEDIHVGFKSSDSKDSQLFVKVKGENKQYQISEDDILFVEASGNYSKIFVENMEYTTPQKLSEIEEKLSTNTFIRIHRSYLVSREKIKSIEGNQIEISGRSLPIGQTYKEQVRSILDL